MASANITSIYNSIELTRKSESGLQTLQNLFRNHATTTAMTRTLSTKISSLGYFLQSIQALLEKIMRNKQGLEKALAPIVSTVENLESRLNSCHRDIQVWIKRVQDMSLDSSQNLGTCKKGSRIAFLTDGFLQIGQQATDHEHGMAADMQILFRCELLSKKYFGDHTDKFLTTIPSQLECNHQR
jgi:hypothetical protein